MPLVSLPQGVLTQISEHSQSGDAGKYNRDKQSRIPSLLAVDRCCRDAVLAGLKSVIIRHGRENWHFDTSKEEIALDGSPGPLARLLHRWARGQPM
jgi:hypothetical protein